MRAKLFKVCIQRQVMEHIQVVLDYVFKGICFIYSVMRYETYREPPVKII